MIITTLAALPFTAHALPASGDCGDSATYTFDSSTGALVISGTGIIRDYFDGFAGSTDIKTIEIKSGITEIGTEVFSMCKAVTSVKLPNTLEEIGGYAFVDCAQLASIKIPNSVTTIYAGAFEGCLKLTSITIPESVKEIDGSVFAFCDNLTTIKVSSKNATYDSRKNCNAIIKKNGAVLVAGCKKTKIPSDVKSIGMDAFYGCIGLTGITIPNSVTKVGARAFSCSGIRTITFPNSVKIIAYNAFEDCTSLYYVKLPNQLKTISNDVFTGCNNIQNIIIPASVKDVRAQFCNSKKKINLWYACTKANHKKISFEDLEEEGYLDNFDSSGIIFTKHTWTTDEVKNHFNYKEHKHKWVTKKCTSTFTKAGKKTATCSVCGMTNANVPADKLTGTKINKLTAGRKAFTATYKKSANVSGYQIQCATDKGFTKNKKTVTVKGSKNTKATVSKLKAKKKYFVRVRAYKVVNKKKSYSKWSAVKTIKTN